MLSKKGSQSLVGKWTGDLPDMGTITLIFKDDMTCDINIGGAMEFTAKYSVDYSADPITLDQFDFNNSEMGDMRYLAIFKFIDANKIMMCGNIDSQGDRPTNFEYQAYELTRE
ncbi:hypothetical protein ACFL2X_00630 [Candidatus Latescibacterota bacterium]